MNEATPPAPPAPQAPALADVIARLRADAEALATLAPQAKKANDDLMQLVKDLQPIVSTAVAILKAAKLVGL